MSEYQFEESDTLINYIKSYGKDRHGFAVVDEQLIDSLYRWSVQAYGPGQRTAGIIDHIKKELTEIEKDPTDLEEWIDVILLALNGAQRLDVGGEAIIEALHAKIVKNAKRTWPDWRDTDPNKAIEHDRTGE